MKNKMEINDILVEIQNIRISEIIAFLSPTIIYYGVQRKIMPSYNLRKDFKIKNTKTEILPVEVIRKYNDVDENRLLEQIYGQSLVDFFRTVSEEVSKEDLNILFNNFSTLTTVIKSFKISNKINNKSVAGLYKPTKNIVEVSKKDQERTIDHELFHAATTIYDPKTRNIFCGFLQVRPDIEIGRSFNEGYTQYITEKFFGNKKELLRAYAYETSIAQAVEIIVGQKKMQSLYFNANLKGLVDCLKQYNDEEKVYNFFTTLDFIGRYIGEDIKTQKSYNMMVESFMEVNHFLIETFINKLVIENKTENTDIEALTSKFDEEITNFLPLIPATVKKRGSKKIYKITDYDIIANNIQNSISKQNDEGEEKKKR